MKHEEDNLLIACVSWADGWFKKHFPVLCVKQYDKRGESRLVAPLVHVANERATTPQAGARLKRKGVRAGFPDLYLAAFYGHRRGLFIELKTKTGRLSKNQAAWAEYLGNGYSCAGIKYRVCRSLDEFQTGVKEYMSE